MSEYIHNFKANTIIAANRNARGVSYKIQSVNTTIARGWVQTSPKPPSPSPPMHATLITQPKLRLITSKSAHFPEGNRAAFQALESHLKSLKGRKFYGLVYATDDRMDYHAGLVPDNEIEERRFAALGFPITEIEAGRCARLKLLDWTSKVDQIGPSFGAMMDQFDIDPSRPQMEYYRSLSELHLLLPVTKESH